MLEIFSQCLPQSRITAAIFLNSTGHSSSLLSPASLVAPGFFFTMRSMQYYSFCPSNICVRLNTNKNIDWNYIFLAFKCTSITIFVKMCLFITRVLEDTAAKVMFADNSDYICLSIWHSCVLKYLYHYLYWLIIS